jgi:hypothetical protein
MESIRSGIDAGFQTSIFSDFACFIHEIGIGTIFSMYTRFTTLNYNYRLKGYSPQLPFPALGVSSYLWG